MLTRVLRISDDEKVYGYVEKVTKAFTVQLPSYALELVKLHACILVAFSFITQALEEEIMQCITVAHDAYILMHMHSGSPLSRSGLH